MNPENPKPPPAKAQRPVAFAISAGLLLGILILQWSTITQDEQRAAEDRLFSGQSCKDKYPPPWRTHNVGLSAAIMPRIEDFGINSCQSMEFRPSTCNEEHFLVRCYEQEQRKGFFKVYRIELENGDVFTVYPDLT